MENASPWLFAAAAQRQGARSGVSIARFAFGLLHRFSNILGRTQGKLRYLKPSIATHAAALSFVRRMHSVGTGVGTLHQRGFQSKFMIGTDGMDRDIGNLASDLQRWDELCGKLQRIQYLNPR